MYRTSLLLCSLLFLGCASCAKNPYYNFYTPVATNGTLPCSTVEVRHNTDVNVDPLDIVAQAWSEGYTLTGYSTWNGTREYRREGVAQAAEEHGACLAVTVKKYIRMQKAVGTEVWEVFDTDGGYRRLVSQYPAIINQYIYMGLYFSRLEAGSGLLVLDAALANTRYVLPEKGAAVIAVRPASPAAVAGISAGDVVLAVDGREAAGDTLEALCSPGKHTFVLLRGKQRLNVFVAIGQAGQSPTEALHFLRQKPVQSLDIMPDDKAREYREHRVFS